MKNDYKCPKCHGNVRVGESIILAARHKRSQGGLVLLHPEPGNYTVITHPDFIYEKGDIIEFHCPICHHNLNSNKHINLALLIMTDENGLDFDIYFSKVAGEQSTLKLIGEHMEIYGHHSGGYIDFFSLSQNC